MRFNKAKIIINPAANHGEANKFIGTVSRFFEDKISFETVLTKRPGHAREIAAELQEFDLVVAVGGDGTAHEVVNGLVQSSNRKTSLAIVPTGSGNDFRRALGISTNINRALEQIVEGKTSQIDLGCVNGAYYTNSLGIGFDARVAHLANYIKDEVKRSGIPLYLTALFRVLFKDYYCHPVRIKIDGGDWVEKEVVLVAANNGVSYGGGFMITPGARNDDGLLEICIVDKLTKWQVIPRLPFVILGRHTWMKQVSFHKAKKVVIESKGELAAHLDGELMIANRFDVKIVPKALKVVVGGKRGLTTDD